MSGLPSPRLMCPSNHSKFSSLIENEESNGSLNKKLSCSLTRVPGFNHATRVRQACLLLSCWFQTESSDHDCEIIILSLHKDPGCSSWGLFCCELRWDGERGNRPSSTASLHVNVLLKETPGRATQTPPVLNQLSNTKKCKHPPRKHSDSVNAG